MIVSPGPPRPAATPASPALRPALTRFVRLAVAGGLTAFILWKSQPRQVLAAAAGAEWRPLAAAALLVLVDRVLMAYRWIVLLYTLDPADRPPLADILRIFFVSTFLGIVITAVSVLMLAVVAWAFIWAAKKDGEEDRADQKRLGIRRRTRLGR